VASLCLSYIGGAYFVIAGIAMISRVSKARLFQSVRGY
jgi:hypothetical protein